MLASYTTITGSTILIHDDSRDADNVTLQLIRLRPRLSRRWFDNSERNTADATPDPTDTVGELVHISVAIAEAFDEIEQLLDDAVRANRARRRRSTMGSVSVVTSHSRTR